MRSHFSCVCLTVASGLSLLLSGCSLSVTSAPTPDAGVAFRGVVRGGQQVITGAHVYLFAANAGVFTPNANGYGNASISLLTNVPGQTTLDSGGGPTNGDYYVTTDANGSFGITGDYTCTATQQVYLYVLGGNPGAGTNLALGLLEVLGSCPTGVGGGSFATQTPYVVVNEATTV